MHKRYEDTLQQMIFLRQYIPELPKDVASLKKQLMWTKVEILAEVAGQNITRRMGGDRLVMNPPGTEGSDYTNGVEMKITTIRPSGMLDSRLKTRSSNRFQTGIGGLKCKTGALIIYVYNFISGNHDAFYLTFNEWRAHYNASQGCMNFNYNKKKRSYGWMDIHRRSSFAAACREAALYN